MPDQPSAHRTRRARALGLVLLVLTLVGCFLCTLLLFGDAVSHDLTLRAHEAEFKAMAHPPDTTLVARKSRVGLLAGNGNHCDYFVGELRTYSGPQEAISAFYDGYRPAGELAWLGIFFFEDGVLPEEAYWDLPQGLDSLSGWSRRLAHSREDYYIVCTVDVGYPPGFDLRCH